MVHADILPGREVLSDNLIKIKFSLILFLNRMNYLEIQCLGIIKLYNLICTLNNSS
jgi:hypothetical protein